MDELTAELPMLAFTLHRNLRPAQTRKMPNLRLTVKTAPDYDDSNGLDSCWHMQS